MPSVPDITPSCSLLSLLLSRLQPPSSPTRSQTRSCCLLPAPHFPCPLCLHDAISSFRSQLKLVPQETLPGCPFLIQIPLRTGSQGVLYPYNLHLSLLQFCSFVGIWGSLSLDKTVSPWGQELEIFSFTNTPSTVSRAQEAFNKYWTTWVNEARTQLKSVFS